MRLWQGIVRLGLGQRVADAVIGRVPTPCWVAEITGPDPRYRWARKFVKGKKDYAKANSKGSRGVFVWYTLQSGRVYDVQARVTWRRTERYFCRVDDAGEVVRMTEEEVRQWFARQQTAE